LLVLRTQKQQENDLARAIEESKFEAGLPSEIDQITQQEEEEQLKKAIDLSKLEAFELVRQKSIEQKKKQVQKVKKEEEPESKPVILTVKDEFANLIYAWGNNDRG
jgi:hypothetical protein